MKGRSGVLLLLCAVVMLVPGLAAQGVPRILLEQVIRHDDWPQHRNVDALLSLTPVRDLLALYQEDGGQRITIRYPGGDYGDAWAHELREWLVALGVPSAQVFLEPGSGGHDRILLLVEQTDV